MKEFIDPDEPQQKKYNWDIQYQQQILSMLLMDRVFLIQSMQLVEADYFVDRCHQTLCEILFKYFDEYKQLPTKLYIINEIKEKYPEDAKKVLLYTGELEGLTSSFIPGLESREACLDKITEFAKEMSLRKAVSVTLEILEKNPNNKWTKIESLFREALMTDRSFDLGLDYFQTVEERYERMEKMDKNKEVFITGFESIDRPDLGLASGGLGRGEIGAFMGMAGSGKSLALCKASVVNLVRGKKVLYISLEMDQDKIARRFDSMLSREPIRELMDRKNLVINALTERAKKFEDKRLLIIKQFPAGTADMHTIRAYMAQLGLHGFKPDLLCVDYVGEFKDDPKMKIYESRQNIVRDLRGFGVEENHCTFTALQSNRSGRQIQEQNMAIDDSELGDSYGQVRPLDCLWSINQSQNEKMMYIGRIFVAKHRDGRSRYYLYFKQDKNTLDIQEISHDTYGNLLSQASQKNIDITGEQLAATRITSRKFKANER